MKRYFFYFIGIVIVAFMFNGCSTLNNKGKMLKGSSQSTNATKVSESGIKYPNVNENSNTQNETSNAAQLQEAINSLKKDIHFQFNSYQIEPIHQYGINENPVEILNKIAAFMLKHPSLKLRIEGNCDERGTEEYNLALGEKRALAAKRYLVAKGISPERIDTVSYGESQPVDPAHNEIAWAKNRRDHFVFIK